MEELLSLSDKRLPVDPNRIGKRDDWNIGWMGNQEAWFSCCLVGGRALFLSVPLYKMWKVMPRLLSAQHFQVVWGIRVKMTYKP